MVSYFKNSSGCQTLKSGVLIWYLSFIYQNDPLNLLYNTKKPGSISPNRRNKKVRLAHMKGGGHYSAARSTKFQFTKFKKDFSN